MSGAVLPFTGSWQGGHKPAGRVLREQRSAMFEARQLINAKTANDDWTARMLIALLSVLDASQRERLEIALMRGDPGGSSGTQALAVAHIANSDAAEKHRISAALDALQSQECGV